MTDLYPSKMNVQSQLEWDIIVLEETYDRIVANRGLCKKVEFDRGEYVDESFARVQGDISRAIYRLRRIDEELN